MCQNLLNKKNRLSKFLFIFNIIVHSISSYSVLDIWDTSGQERYESLTILFYRDAEIILLLFNYNNKKSFQRAKHFLTKIKTVNKEPDLVIILT